MSALPDPTRPHPNAFVDDSPGDIDNNAPPPPVGLQTVIMRKGAKPLAIVNGQTVELGGKIGDARLVRLSDTEAVLQGPNGREVLRLTPAVERKPVILRGPAAKAKAKASARNKTKPKSTK